MKINIQKIYKASFYILLFLNLYFGSIELNIVIGLLITFLILFFPLNKYSTTLINICQYLEIPISSLGSIRWNG